MLRTIGRLELLVISHIDADHIEGAMPMVKEDTAPLQVTDVWFNAWHHLRNAEKRLKSMKDLDVLGPEQGEKLSNGIVRFKWPWNVAFGKSGIVSVDSPEAAGPIELAGGLKITMLSPGDEELAKLEPVWMAELAKANLRPFDPDQANRVDTTGLEVLSPLNVPDLAAKPFAEDAAPANGSSIAFLAEFEGRRVLLGADAHPDVLERSLIKLGYSEANRLKVDVWKLSHHGSKANTSPSLLKIVDCARFAISTDGTKHNHPNRETIARLLANGATRRKIFYFNVRQPNAEIWDQAELQKDYNYICTMPADGASGITIDI
jgi:beta-lactamase superfamily II metal-dependent hydrolase